MKSREVMYWPGISRDIEDTITRCRKCSEWQRNNQKEPLIPHEVPGRPWQKLGADIFEFRGKNYLCVVDYYSKFPETSLLSSKTSSSVVVNLKSIFARHGVPDELVADNYAVFKPRAATFCFIVGVPADKLQSWLPAVQWYE